MNSAPDAAASAKMRSYISAGVQQVCTIACDDTGTVEPAACGHTTAQTAAISDELSSRRDIPPER